jgi:hypothetical protein
VGIFIKNQEEMERPSDIQGLSMANSQKLPEYGGLDGTVNTLLTLPSFTLKGVAAIHSELPN